MKIDTTDDIQLTPSSSPKSKTERVLEKWETEGEIHKDSIRKAASEYAKLEINNKILKWIIVVVVTLLFVLLGFMIASVVLGVQITKDVTVKNGQLVTNSDKTVVKTSTVKYHSKITLNSPAKVIDTLSSISVNVNEGLYQGVLQFDVVSYVFVPGKQLTFYGHTHVANILPDGTVSVKSLVPMVGTRDATSDDVNGGSASGYSSSTADSVAPQQIKTCEDLEKIGSNNANTIVTGDFEVMNNLDCSNKLKLPLLEGRIFAGNINGGEKYLTLAASSTGPIALFETFQGFMKNWRFNGKLDGNQFCGGIAVKVLAGAYISKVSSTLHITCNELAQSDNTVAGAAGGLFAIVEPDNSNPDRKVTIYNSCSQTTITYNEKYATGKARVGGFIGFSNSPNSPAQSLCFFERLAADSTLVTSGLTDQFGFYFNGESDVQKENNLCLTETGKSSTYFKSCYGQERSPNLANSRNCNGWFCFASRDVSMRNPNGQVTKDNYQSRYVMDRDQTEVYPQPDNFMEEACAENN